MSMADMFLAKHSMYGFEWFGQHDCAVVGSKVWLPGALQKYSNHSGLLPPQQYCIAYIYAPVKKVDACSASKSQRNLITAGCHDSRSAFRRQDCFLGKQLITVIRLFLQWRTIFRQKGCQAIPTVIVWHAERPEFASAVGDRVVVNYNDKFGT